MTEKSYDYTDAFFLKLDILVQADTSENLIEGLLDIIEGIKHGIDNCLCYDPRYQSEYDVHDDQGNSVEFEPIKISESEDA